MTLTAPLRPSLTLPGFLALAALASAMPAAAVHVGEATVYSVLGRPLDATFALAADAGETLGPECFRLGSARGTRLLLEARATFAVESRGGAQLLRLRTTTPINAATLQVRVSAACPGGRATTRDFSLAIGPPAAISPAIAQSLATPANPAAPAAAAGSSFGKGSGTLAGDTLDSLAAAIYPRNQEARQAYVGALQEENPALAGLGAQEPIPPGTSLVLPDLRNFSTRLAATQATRSVRIERPVPTPRPPALKAEKPRPVPPAPRAPLPERSQAFSLRLSGPVLDLSRSRGVDESQRARLRERILAMDADDKVAAILALRHSLSRLEGRIAELQLKLSSLSTATAAASPTPVTPSAPSKSEAATAKPAATPAPAAATSVPAASPPVPSPPKTPARPPAPAAGKAPVPHEPNLVSTIPPWLFGVFAALAALVSILAGLWLRRRNVRPPQTAGSPEEPAGVSDLDEAEALMRADDRSEPVLADRDEGRVVAESDAGLATRVGGDDPAMLRRRYLEERFPEIAVGTVALDDPDSVVKAARLFYEDGALPRAVEILQFAVEEHPAAMKPWLALFEIFRLEDLAGEFGALAERFREHHGGSENWRKVQFIGRELDPQDPLYHDAPQAHLETIVPLSAAVTPVAFDPLTENWLSAPTDTASAALASTLRAALLADAGVREDELAPDPMPALKGIEMFHVA